MLLLSIAGCADAEPEAGARVGGVSIPASRLASLGEIERESLADLIGIGSAIASGETDSLLAPIIGREIAASRIAGLPYHLAAEELGLRGAELERAYAGSPEWELTVRHVVRLVDFGASPAQRDSARAVAEEVLADAAAGIDFADLAARYSEEPRAAERGGLLQPGREGSWVQPFWDAAARLEPGQVSGVVETEYGFHVLHLDARRPLPYEAANRTRLLQRVVPLEAASAAMEGWASENGGVLLDAPSIRAARSMIEAGVSPSDTLVLATGASGGRFDGEDLVAAWARLQPQERAGLESADEVAFAAWMEEEAREVIWAEAAESMGVEASSSTEAAARASWYQTVTGWAHLFGFGPGLAPEEIYGHALQAALSGTPELRGARIELRSLRPRLRRLYPYTETSGTATPS